jgi:hypothetical protein
MNINLAEVLVSELRDIPHEGLVEAMTPFLRHETLEELVVILFHLRNVRGGYGRRDLFRAMMNILHEYDSSLVNALLPLVPEYGYWKDVFFFSMTLPHLLGPTMELCRQQLLKDEESVRLGYKPSLLAKYIPKQGKKYTVFAHSFAKYMYPEVSPHSVRVRNIRKRISALNQYTGAVEVKMCAGNWDLIVPSSVAAAAKRRYHSALLNEKDGVLRTSDEARMECRQTFLDHRPSSPPSTLLTTESEAYLPVRTTVKSWLLLQSLNRSN